VSGLGAGNIEEAMPRDAAA